MPNLLKIFVITLAGSLFILNCENDSEIDTDKNTYYDDIADITYLNGSFYTTNYDLSGNAGSQIDLLKFHADDSIYVTDRFDLEMNGQGYISITNDGSDLYLQSRETSLIRKCSPIGENAYTDWDTISTNWQPCGITYLSEKDSLLTLYRNLDTLTQYRARVISKDRTFTSSMDTVFHFDFIDTTYNGIYALTHKGSSFYMLGVDTSMTDILILTDNHFVVTDTTTITDSTVVGLCFRGNDLYFSYRDKRIQYWKTY